MGSDVTKTNALQSAFLVPWPFSATLAADNNVGTDYAEIDREMGAFAQDNPSPVGIAAVGEPPSALTQLAFRCSKSGAPGGAEWRWSSDGGTTFYGFVPHTICTGHSTNAALSGTDDTHAIPLSTGGFVSLVPDSAHYDVTAVDTSFSTTANTLATDPSNLTTGTGCVLVDPTDTDGTKMLAFVAGGTDSNLAIDCYRTTDGAATWTKIADDVNPSITETVIRIRAAAIGGQVLMIVTGDASGTTTTRQLYSVNGGATFTEVTSATNQAVGDIKAVGGYFVVSLNTNVDSGTPTIKVIRIGDASTSFLSDAGVDVTSTSVLGEIGSSLLVEPSGRLWVSWVRGSGEQLDRAYSDDAGATFNDDIISTPSATTDSGVGPHAMVTWRDKILALAADYDGTTITNSGNVFHYGGFSTIAYDEAFAHYAWVPTDGIDAGSGWTITTTGAPTLTRPVGGYRVQCGAGDTWKAVRTQAAQGDGGAVFHFVHDTSQSLVTTFEVGNATNQASVDVDFTGTQLRAYGTGTAAPSFTTHGIAGDLEVLVCLNAAADECEVYYREWTGTETEKTWSAITASNSILGGSYNGIRLTFDMPATSDNYFRFIGFQGYIFRETPLAAASPDVADMPGVPLPPIGGAFVEGVRVVSEGGLEYRSDDDHAATATSPYRKANTIPAVEPSPFLGWRTDTAAATSLRYRFNEAGSDPVDVSSDSIGVYLSGLSGVIAVNIKDETTTLTNGAVTLGYAFDYTRAGSDSVCVEMAESGATDAGPWVEPDELAGLILWFPATSKARVIRSNTEGVLTHGATIAEKRAMIYLEEVDGSEGTSGTARILPESCLFVIHKRGRTSYTQIRVEIGSSEMTTDATGFVDVGCVAIGEVTYLGRQPDKTEVGVLSSNTERAEREDGRTSVRTRGRQRSRWTMAFVDSFDDVTQISGDNPDPDYVTSSDNASAVPTATRHGFGRVLRGIYRQAGGDKTPVLYVDGLERDDDSGDAYRLYQLNTLGGVYGRFDGDVREEHVPSVGRRRASDLLRYPTVTIVEEV